jgi:aromatic-L-amino-acid decarboxylase
MLDITPEQMRAMADAVVSRCIQHLASIDAQPSSGIENERIDDLCRELREPAPERGTDLETLLNQLFLTCIPHSFTTIAPGYLAYIPGGGLYPAALANFISDTTNRFTGMRHSAPALVQLEANALDWLRDWMGFPQTTRGLFTTGGSMATLSAVVCARERHLGPDIRPGVLYMSDQAHHSVAKSARIAGIMPDRVRSIPSDGRFRMDLEALAEAVANDRREGLQPFMVVSTAGTTNTGAVDPLEAIGEICRREGLWHHVDGAYGAFFLCCRELHELLKGLSAADSLTLDPHKGMFLPYGTGALLVRDGGALRAAYQSSASYLPAASDAEEFYDPSQHGPELSRGFPGLRVWLSLKFFGTAAFRDAIAQKRRLALDACRRLSALPGIVVDAPPELSLMAFHVSWPGASKEDENAATKTMVEQTTRRKRVMITGCTSHGRFMGRVCVLNFRTHERHIDQLVEDVASTIGNLLPSLHSSTADGARL